MAERDDNGSDKPNAAQERMKRLQQELRDRMKQRGPDGQAPGADDDEDLEATTMFSVDDLKEAGATVREEYPPPPPPPPAQQVEERTMAMEAHEYEAPVTVQEEDEPEEPEERTMLATEAFVEPEDASNTAEQEQYAEPEEPEEPEERTMLAPEMSAEPEAHEMKTQAITGPKAVLTVLMGPDQGQRFLLGEGVTFVGRALECQVVLNDASTSRKHFKIENHAQGYTLIDLGSENGTAVNGERVRRQEMEVDAQISVGTTLLHFGYLGSPPPTLAREVPELDPEVKPARSGGGKGKWIVLSLVMVLALGGGVLVAGEAVFGWWDIFGMAPKPTKDKVADKDDKGDDDGKSDEDDDGKADDDDDDGDDDGKADDGDDEDDDGGDDEDGPKSDDGDDEADDTGKSDDGEDDEKGDDDGEDDEKGDDDGESTSVADAPDAGSSAPLVAAVEDAGSTAPDEAAAGQVAAADEDAGAAAEEDAGQVAAVEDAGAVDAGQVAAVEDAGAAAEADAGQVVATAEDAGEAPVEDAGTAVVAAAEDAGAAPADNGTGAFVEQAKALLAERKLDEAQGKLTEAIKAGAKPMELQPIFKAIGLARVHKSLVSSQEKALAGGNHSLVAILAKRIPEDSPYHSVSAALVEKATAAQNPPEDKPPEDKPPEDKPPEDKPPADGPGDPTVEESVQKLVTDFLTLVMAKDDEKAAELLFKAEECSKLPAAARENCAKDTEAMAKGLDALREALKGVDVTKLEADPVAVDSAADWGKLRVFSMDVKLKSAEDPAVFQVVELDKDTWRIYWPIEEEDPAPQTATLNTARGFKMYRAGDFAGASRYFIRASRDQSLSEDDRRRAGAFGRSIKKFEPLYESGLRATSPIPAIKALTAALALDRRLNRAYQGKIKTRLAKQHTKRAQSALAANRLWQAAKAARQALSLDKGQGAAKAVLQKLNGKVSGLMQRAIAAKNAGRKAEAKRLFREVILILGKGDRRRAQAKRMMEGL